MITDARCRPRRDPSRCTDVTVIALESPEEIPADPEEIDEADTEGITHRVPPRTAPRSSATGGSTGLETIDVEVGVRRRAALHPGLRHRRRSDVSGRHGDPRGRPADRHVVLLDELGIERNRGGIKVDRVHAHLPPEGLGRRRRRLRAAQPHRRDRRRPARRGVDPGHPRRVPPTSRSVQVEAHRRARLPPRRHRRTTRSPAPAIPTPPSAQRGRLRRGRDRLRRTKLPCSRRCAACAASTTSCSSRSCASSAGCASTCARRTASRSPAPSRPAPATERRSCCCSTRTSAFAAGCASTGARPARCRWSTPRRCSVDALTDDDPKPELEPGGARRPTTGWSRRASSAATRGGRCSATHSSTRHAGGRCSRSPTSSCTCTR